MKSIIKRGGAHKNQIIVSYPDNFYAEEANSQIILINDFDQAKGQEKRTMINGAMIVERQLQINQPYFIEVEHDFPFLKMQFEMEGYSLFNSFIQGVPQVEIPGGSHRLFFLPEVNGRLHYFKNRNTLEINLTADFVTRTFKDLNTLNCIGNGMLNVQPVLLSPKAMPILPEMFRCISQIKNCPYAGELKKVFLENKVSELLIMQLHQTSKTAENSTSNILTKKEKEKLYEVKEIIENNITQPYTITELSSLAGINEFKLKKGFKQLFGFTLFGYLTEVRLSKAKEMLENEELAIGEIAYKVGYKYSQHFATAFKRKYGVLPSYYR